VKNLSNPFFITLFSSVVLTACGGGTGANQDTAGTQSEPTQVTAKNWQNAQAKLDSNATLTAKTITRHRRITQTQFISTSYLQLKINGSVDKPAHKQYFVDIDNNPATGFQFENELWSAKSGVDYLIQDGMLYKSTANDSSWSWELVKTVSKNASTGIELLLSRQHDFEPLCNDLNIAYIERDSDWNVIDYFPRSNQMLKQTVSFCEVYNEPPRITLLGNGLEHLVFELDDPLYADPGATAFDTEDGDITSKMIVNSNVNIHKEGLYTITYTVTDSKGLTAKRTRRINVIKPSLTGVIIDGKLGSDWSTVNPIVNYDYKKYNGHFYIHNWHYLKVTNTDKKLYFIADSVRINSAAPHVANGSTVRQNWQFFLDIDNNSTTGYNGYDYLVENGYLYKFSGLNSQEWSWKEISDVNFARGFTPTKPTRGLVELEVPRSLLSGLEDTVKVKFVQLSSNWQSSKSFGNLYKLK